MDSAIQRIFYMKGDKRCCLEFHIFNHIGFSLARSVLDEQLKTGLDREIYKVVMDQIADIEGQRWDPSKYVPKLDNLPVIFLDRRFTI